MYRWVTRNDIADRRGLRRRLGFVHDGKHFGDVGASYATTGHFRSSAATFPLAAMQRYVTGSGIFQLSSEEGNTEWAIYRSADGVASYTEVLRGTVSYASGYPAQIFDGGNGRVFYAEYGDPDPGSRLYYSADNGVNWGANAPDCNDGQPLFQTAANAIRHFHGGKYDPLHDRLYLFTGDAGAHASIVWTDDVDDLVANPATWRDRWGLSDATRSTIVDDWVLGIDDQVYRVVDAIFFGDWIYFGSDSLNGGGQRVARAHRLTHEVQDVYVRPHSPAASNGRAVGEVWLWGVAPTGQLIMAGSGAVVGGGGDGYMHVYALLPGGTEMEEILKVPRTADVGVAIPHRIDTLGDDIIISNRNYLTTQVGRIASRSGIMQQTFPQYDAADRATFTFGLNNTIAGTGTFNSAIPAATAGWLMAGHVMDLQPGEYTLEGVKVAWQFTEPADCDTAYVALYEVDGTDLIPAQFSNGDLRVDVSSYLPNNLNTVATTIPIDRTFTAEASKRYTILVCMNSKATAGGNNRPSFRRMNVGQGPQGVDIYYRPQGIIDFPDGTLGGSTITTSALHLEYTISTTNRKVFASSYSAAKDMLIPVFTDRDAVVKFASAVVAEGQTLTAAMRYNNSGNAGTRTTLALDMGATDQVTFGGANVALAAAGAEAGDTFDLMVQHRPVTGKMDVFFQNRTTGQGPEGAADFVTISHACKNDAAGDGSRGQEYTVGVPEYLSLAGTAAVASIEVGWEPVVLFGDDQVSIADDRLGAHLPSAFTLPRIYWDASIGGNLLTETVTSSHTAGYLRYKHGTPGGGDLCEMTSVLFCFAGFGLNDVTQIGTTEANRRVYASRVIQRTAEILSNLDSTSGAIIIGLPPFSLSGSASEDEAKTIQHQINPALAALAEAARCACYIPWDDMVATDTESDAIPTFIAAYTGDAGLHYNSAGAAIVAAAAARAYEANIAADVRMPSNSARPPRTTNRDINLLLKNHTTADRIQHEHDGTWSVLNESGAVIYRGTQKEVWNHLERTAP